METSDLRSELEYYVQQRVTVTVMHTVTDRIWISARLCSKRGSQHNLTPAATDTLPTERAFVIHFKKT